MQHMMIERLSTVAEIQGLELMLAQFYLPCSFYNDRNFGLDHFRTALFQNSLINMQNAKSGLIKVPFRR